MAKTETKAAEKTEATETPRNPMKEATVTAKITGVSDADIKAYFEGKKVSATKKGQNYVFKYTARGAAKNDIVKRLQVLTRDAGEFEVVEFANKNLDAK